MDLSALRGIAPRDDDATPKYLQIARELSHLLRSRRWPTNQGLPSERDLAGLLGVSRVTARKALHVVAEEGLVVRKERAGAYVAPHLEQPLSRLSSLSEELALRGMKGSFEWLQRDTAIATAQEQSVLQLKVGERVSRLRRLRCADESPMAIEFCRVPTRVLSNPHQVTTSLYALLDEQGTSVVRATQRISAVNVDEKNAALLELKPRDAVLFVTRVGFDAIGVPIEFTESLCRVDLYDFMAEMTRQPVRHLPR
jgi:GntR family transcriptional regulator